MQPIGISADANDLRTAEEFFELFKTAWEPAVPGQAYDVVLSTRPGPVDLDARVVLRYGSAETDVDRAAGVRRRESDGPAHIESPAGSFPIFGRVATFDGGAHALACGGQPVGYRRLFGDRVVWRIGYDLFKEVRRLLTEGQPPEHAATPTLDHHVTALRSLLVESGVSFVEIPPRPAGHDFICCLTHDVDFFGVRRHRFDRTLAGFIARASFGSLADLMRGRRSLAHAVRNWAAVLSLPLVFLNVAADLWRPFDDYAAVEDGARSTFFLVPFKGRPGVAPDGTVNRARAVPYQVDEIREDMKVARARGSELAVHGIDAWRDAEAGRAELNELRSVTGRGTTGVRMHWLYLTSDSPRQLEAAGFDYDSSWGYNDEVGYRAGTSQVFRLPASERLLELPLAIMDSALFYPARMGLSATEAGRRCLAIIEHARRSGGTVVINWHDRSLAPERLWGPFYRALVDEVGSGNRAWFATAERAVDWFRWRRSFRFTRDGAPGAIVVHGSPSAPERYSALVRHHLPTAGSGVTVRDYTVDGRQPLSVAS